MPFQKGQSGNPNGRPKSEQAITPALRRLLAAKREGKTRAEHVANVLLSLAENGDVNAIKVVLERVDGKVMDHLDLTSGGQPLVKAYVGVDVDKACP